MFISLTTPTDAWENLYLASGKPENILLVQFKNPELKPLTGKSLAEVAKMRGKSPAETAIDLVIEDGSRVGTVYFLMSEDNVKQAVALPWMTFGSDEGSYAPEGDFLKFQPHPRAYGNFARVLGKYVREEHVITLPEAVRRLTSLSAKNLKLRDRGELKPGNFTVIRFMAGNESMTMNMMPIVWNDDLVFFHSYMSTLTRVQRFF